MKKPRLFLLLLILAGLSGCIVQESLLDDKSDNDNSNDVVVDAPVAP